MIKFVVHYFLGLSITIIGAIILPFIGIYDGENIGKRVLENYKNIKKGN